MLGYFTHISPPGYRAFIGTPIPGQGHHAGTTIFVRPDVPFVLQQLHTPLQAVKVFLDRFYTLCSLYLSPDVPVVRPDLDGLARVFPLLSSYWRTAVAPSSLALRSVGLAAREKVADPKTVADLFAGHFSSVS